MHFTSTDITGAWLIDIEPSTDERGLFARLWCQREFAAHGCSLPPAQISLAYSQQRGTLRGLHYQAAPHEEAKLVRVMNGAAFLVVLDLRQESPSYRHWFGIELTAANRRAIYVPPGCAQGYQTLADHTELLYQISEFYEPAAARGVRHDDPGFAIRWPLPVTTISDKDRNWPNYVA
ncbi:MAG TPA: dTDP-4-dehydrorhamnose 3,5-epimerase family protein [Pirellulales bacterium]